MQGLKYPFQLLYLPTSPAVPHAHPREHLTCSAIARLCPFANTAPSFSAMSLVNRFATHGKCEINNSWPIMSLLLALPNFTSEVLARCARCSGVIRFSLKHPVRELQSDIHARAEYESSVGCEALWAQISANRPKQMTIRCGF